MKTSNIDPPGQHAASSTRGYRSTTIAGSKGVIFRDPVNESVGQLRDITLVGLTLTDNEDGTGLITAGSGGGTSGGYSIAESDDLFQTQRGGEGNVVITTTASGTTLTLDLSSGNWFDVTLTGDCTLAFSNPPASGRGYQWTIVLRQDSTGSRTVTWPGSVSWQDTDGTDGGAAPTLYTAATAQDVIVITTLDGGVTYGGGQERSGSGGGTSASDTNIWRPVMAYDGTNWNVLVGGSGDAIMAYGPA